MISAFLDWLEASRGCSASTRNHRLKCIRAFYNYAAQIEPAAVIHQLELRKIPAKKTRASDPVEFMSETAVKTLLEQPDTATEKGLRDQFLMILMYDTAARIQEVLGLRVRDISLGKTPAATLTGKGSKKRTVPLMEKTVRHFENYMEIFHPGTDAYSNAPLFYVVRNGEKQVMSDDNVRKFMREYGCRARHVCPDVPENVHPHLWRHSRAMHLYRRGMDLTLVSQWLGHAYLETTLVYAHADTELKRKAIEKATAAQNPLKENRETPNFTVSDDELLKRLYGLK